MKEDTANKAEGLRLGGEFYFWLGGQLRDASGNDVPLRAKSLKMFATLLSERGKVLSKDELSALVWPDTVATDESISRCISDIRKALGDENHDIVQTYPKQGYRLNAVAAKSEMEASHKTRRSIGLWSALAITATVAAFGVLTLNQNLIRSDTSAEVTQRSSPHSTVAIIPFTSEGEDGRFLALGISDDLEIHLAEISGLKILSQAQTATVVSDAKGPLEIASSLGASHVVLGSLRQNSDQIALSVKLVDGSDGTTLWADRYEGMMDGLIPFRDRVPEALVNAMSVELNSHDLDRLAFKDTDNPKALREVMHARRELSHFTYQSSLEAEKRLRRAVSFDPQYARAYAELASAFAIRMENDWIVLSRADTQKAFYFAERALELDPNLWFGHYAIGRLHSVAPSGDIEAAVHHLEKAMELNPANDDARAYYAIVAMMSGEVEKGRKILESVISSHPNAPFWYHLGHANALFHLRRYEAAQEAISHCLKQMPNSPYCLRTQMAVQARLGQFEDAAWTIEEYAILGYDTALEAVMKSAIERDPDMLSHLRESYELSGLK